MGAPSAARAPAPTWLAAGSLGCGVVGLALALVPPFGIIGVMLALGAVIGGWATLRAPSVRGSANPGMAMGGLAAGLLTVLVFAVTTMTEFIEGEQKEDQFEQQIEPYRLDGVCNPEYIATDPDC